MVDAALLIRPRVHEMAAYQPILPFEVLSQQLGMPTADIIKLDANENPYGPLPAVTEALADLPYAHIYPDPESRELRKALAAYHGVPFENLLAGAGADELIDLIMRLFLDPGDVVVNCPPTFGMYAFDADVNGAQVVSVPRQPDFTVDLGAVTTAVKAHRPKLMFLASPNNPDGGLLSPDVVEQLLALPVVVVLDEAYVEFAPSDTSRIADVAARNNLIVLRTFSKWAGLAGLRVGYGVFPGSLMPHLWKIKQPYNVSVAASTAAMVSLKYVDQLERRARAIKHERKRLYETLQEIPWLEPYASHTNFILCRVAGGARKAAALKAGLAREGILIRYFEKPGLSDHVRISIGKPEHTDMLLAELKKWQG